MTPSSFGPAGRWCLLMAGVVLLSACTGLPAPRSAPDFSQISLVAMMPVQNMAAIYGAASSVRNPLSGRVFATGPVGASDAQSFEAGVYSRFVALGRFRVLPPGSALGAMSSLTATQTSHATDRSLWIDSGRALNAQAVLVAFLYRYSDRIGSRYAAQQPASVAFDLYLLRVPDGRILWTGLFNETQRALSENLLELNKFIKRKGWVSADELAAAGLDDVMATLTPPGKAKDSENEP